MIAYHWFFVLHTKTTLKTMTTTERNDEGSTTTAAMTENCFDCLTDEILFLVLSFVPPGDLLRKVCTSCTRFAAAIQSDTFWIKSTASSATLLEKVNPSLCLSKHQLQQYSLFDAAVKNSRHDDTTTTTTTLKLLQHGSVLCTRETAVQLRRQGKRTCAASTTDRPTESLENVLSVSHDNNNDGDRIAGSIFFRRFRFSQQWWSSRPTPEPDTRTEVLLFTTCAPLCLLTQVLVKPLLDPYVGHVVYSWCVALKHFVKVSHINNVSLTDWLVSLSSFSNRKFTKICAYLFPDNETKLTHGYPCTFTPNYSKNVRATAIGMPFVLDDTSCMENLLSNQTPVYENTWPVLNPFSNQTITFDLPAKGVLANVLTVELIGKHVEQTPGSGYYACIDMLDCKGIPLHADASGAQHFASDRW